MQIETHTNDDGRRPLTNRIFAGRVAAHVEAAFVAFEAFESNTRAEKIEKFFEGGRRML